MIRSDSGSLERAHAAAEAKLTTIQAVTAVMFPIGLREIPSSPATLKKGLHESPLQNPSVAGLRVGAHDRRRRPIILPDVLTQLLTGSPLLALTPDK